MENGTPPKEEGGSSVALVRGVSLRSERAELTIPTSSIRSEWGEMSTSDFRSMVSSPSPPSSPFNTGGRNRVQEIVADASSAEYKGPPQKTIHLARNETAFNPETPQIKRDIIRMITQYLANEGYHASMMTIQDEAGVKFNEQLSRRTQIKRIKKLIMEGDYAEVEKLCTKHVFKNYKAFLYSVYRQQYLELVDRQEYQKAFACLTKRLKPLESMQTNPDEFRDLCYLITCKSIGEVPAFKGWAGIVHSREQLVEKFESMIDLEDTTELSGHVRVPPNRLLELLQKACAYQIEISRYQSKVYPHIHTLLEDYQCFLLPNAQRTLMKGHRYNVKCVEFVGEEGLSIVSGSSDNTLRLWSTETGECQRILTGHESRVWDVSSTKTGDFIASASGDASVKIWDVRPNSKQECIHTLSGHEGDVYSVRFHPGQAHVVTGGYDKSVRLFDTRTGTLLKTFSGHTASVTKTIFNQHGNLIISGSKDATIRFWDIVSGLCIKTYSAHLGEVTSVDLSPNGNLLLSAAKDNSNRLWDLRQARQIQRFKGHQNTSLNLIRAVFGPTPLVIGGSEDSCVYLWDSETSQILQRLHGHSGPVYSTAWSAEQSLLASCGEDHSVRTWWFDRSKPIFDEDKDPPG
mmetsp:Transcript_42775/g.69354  ORF Transcript_42775/g.69354 Transcript_42775/m.69354 type:complete len:631 (-) Transcript_42775:57-1949(-)|eukprot:CAMPEP_0184648002 /NCGR_PEP_ID=MMETSP0308-20130426/5049_1 /TAXON_ID=38269 /ORGANISM="Gloeochaete witrockiana, Strain SAG 46.84" /LENGTH=630 /DNA_ID=CAMNT_0027079477 /DNA_START=1165 /DNA_END=3057 /DNA_ORIENTATION=-